MRPLQSSARLARVGAGSRVSTSSSPSSSSAPAPPRRRSSRAPRSATSVGSALASQVVPSLPYDLQEGVEQGMWSWQERNCSVRYQKAGVSNADAPAVVLIHGFGGNCDHWRKNIGPLARSCRVYSIDLLGYGYSDKPCPKDYGEPNELYNFYTWADQINAFLEEVVHEDGTACRDTVLVCNSVGSVAGLQAIASDAKRRGPGSKFDYRGIALLNPSLRLLHVKKQAPLARPFVKAFQSFLRETPAGEVFFSQVAQPRAIENILKEAYHDPSAVSQELVSCVLNPGLQPGAVKVFLDFISYSGGPLPEELIPEMPCPVELIWGEEDPWEPIEVGRKEYSGFDTVRNFVTLPGVGHCPMDEAASTVNPLIADFVKDVC